VEVKVLEITINAKQLIAIAWTMIAIVLSVIVVLAIGFFPNSWFVTGWPWWALIATFFGVWLIIVLPVYLLIALWGVTSNSATEK
jgi:uncharacterized membrane protein